MAQVQRTLQQVIKAAQKVYVENSKPDKEKEKKQEELKNTTSSAPKS